MGGTERVRSTAVADDCSYMIPIYGWAFKLVNPIKDGVEGSGGMHYVKKAT